MNFDNKSHQDTLYLREFGNTSLEITLEGFPSGRVVVRLSTLKREALKTIRVFPSITSVLWARNKWRKNPPSGETVLEEQWIYGNKKKEIKMTAVGENLWITGKISENETEFCSIALLLTGEEADDFFNTIETAFHAYMVAGFIVEYRRNHTLDIFCD